MSFSGFSSYYCTAKTILTKNTLLYNIDSKITFNKCYGKKVRESKIEPETKEKRDRER